MAASRLENTVESYTCSVNISGERGRREREGQNVECKSSRDGVMLFYEGCCREGYALPTILNRGNTITFLFLFAKMMINDPAVAKL